MGAITNSATINEVRYKGFNKADALKNLLKIIFKNLSIPIMYNHLNQIYIKQVDS